MVARFSVREEIRGFSSRERKRLKIPGNVSIEVRVADVDLNPSLMQIFNLKQAPLLKTKSI